MKILVAYDGSNAADAALDLACVHAQALSAHILIITSIEGQHCFLRQKPGRSKKRA